MWTGYYTTNTTKVICVKVAYDVIGPIGFHYLLKALQVILTPSLKVGSVTMEDSYKVKSANFKDSAFDTMYKLLQNDLIDMRHHPSGTYI